MPRASAVSVVVPVFNHEAFLADAVRSAAAQGPVVREIILVDDGSTDRSFAIAGALAAVDARIVAWSGPNRGAHLALEAGIARATGDVVAILNSDDLWEAGRLDAIGRAFADDPDLVLATTSVRFVDAANGTVANPWYDEAVAFGATCDDLGTALLNGNFLVSTSNYALRRSALGSIGRFAPLRYAHDLDLALRILANGGRVARLDAPLLRYRTHASNTIAEAHDGVRLDWALAAGAYLAARLDEPGAGVSGWRRADRLLGVLAAHRIDRAASLVAAYLRQTRCLTLDRSPVTADAPFLDIVRETL